MTAPFVRMLVNEASRPYRRSGRYAYHFARGKLSSDCIFRTILQRGLLPAQGPLLDLGCGQGSLFAWLLAARRLHEQGHWPVDWAPPPAPSPLRGIELMPRDVARAARAFGPDQPLVRVEQGDMNRVDFGRVQAITLFDVLHYVDHDRQEQVLQRIRAALPPAGVFLTRVGDASAGLPHRLSNGVDHAVAYLRGLRVPRLYCRPLAAWVHTLQALGFEVRTEPMSGGQPFANVMLHCRVPA